MQSYKSFLFTFLPSHPTVSLAHSKHDSLTHRLEQSACLGVISTLRGMATLINCTLAHNLLVEKKDAGDKQPFNRVKNTILTK